MSKNVLQVEHLLGKVRSDAVRIGFASAVDLDECLGCLPRGRELVEAVHGREAARLVEGK